MLMRRRVVLHLHADRNIMKDLASFFVAISCTLPAAAQTLTSADNPVAGTSFELLTGAVVPTPSSGELQTWDLSQLVSAGSTVHAYEGVTDQPDALLFPDADIFFTRPTLNEFLDLQEDGYNMVGSRNLTFDVLIQFSDPVRKMVYPLSYGDSWSDTYAASTTFQGTELQFSGVMHNTATGTGTLLLPDGEISNVLQLTRVDSLIQTGTGDEVLMVDRMVEFLRPGTVGPLAMCRTQMIFTNGALQSSAAVTYFRSIGDVGVDDSDGTLNEFVLVPNPASTTVSCGPLGSHRVTYAIHDPCGRVVEQGTMNGLEGSSLHFDVSDLAAGHYLVTTQSGHGSYESQRLIVEH